jgi:lipopolysaccharide biosynthesis protein
MYKKWLQHISHETLTNLPKSEQFIFVNAWNEWAEGACLEPDRKYGYAFLDATRQVQDQFSKTKLALIQQTCTDLKPSSETAIIIHLYYFDLWPEMRTYLANMPMDFDLYISIADSFTIEQVQILINDYPNVHLFSLENRGRDIYPFMHIFNQIKAFNYQSICKIHSKKSNHTDVGDSWRTNIFNELLGSKQQINAIINTLKANQSIGIISPKQYLIRFYDCLGYNEELAAQNMCFINQFIEQLGTEISADEEFVTGSMFWFKPDALVKLLSLKVKTSDYPVETGQIDGTIMHALERVLTICARVSGYSTIDSSHLN